MVEEQEPEVIREQIRDTQESLASKISTLEDKVVNTVTNTTESVSDTVESVKEKVAETVEAVKDTVTETIATVKDTFDSTVESVKRTLDLEYQVGERPWLMMAGSFAGGFLAGKLLPAAARRAEEFVSEAAGETSRRGRSFAASEPSSSHTNGSTNGEGLFGRLTHQFHDELEQVKGLAVGALFGLARDWATQNLPGNIAPQIHEVIDNLTTKIGGTRIESPVLDNLSSMYAHRKGG